MTNGKSYLYNVAMGLDCFVNSILGGTWHETMSSRVYRNSVKGYWYARIAEKILNCLFKPWDKEHCKESYEAALARGDAPKI